MNLETRQILFDLTEGAAFEPLLELLEELVKEQEAAVVRYDLSTRGGDGLLQLKSEAWGARKLKVAVEAHLRKIRTRLAA